jgi:riboflavin biosynthesis pyrimidine reductase
LPDLDGQAIRAGLVDELLLFIFPIVVGGGKRALRAGSARIWNYWTRSGSQAVLVYLNYRPKSS